MIAGFPRAGNLEHHGVPGRCRPRGRRAGRCGTGQWCRRPTSRRCGRSPRVGRIHELDDRKEGLGERQLRAGLVTDAIYTLRSLTVGRLTPIGATALFEALLDRRVDPEQGLVLSVDWGLAPRGCPLEASAWIGPERLVTLTAEMVRNPPPVLDR